MSWQPFLDASLVLQIHIVSAMIALVLGPFAIWRRKRDRVHKIVGYVYVVAIVVASVVSFGIPSAISPVALGPIHLLAAYGLWGIYGAMRSIYRGDVREHRLYMESVYIRGLAVAGALTLVPGRTSQKMLLPDAPALGIMIAVAVFAWAFAPVVREWRRGQA